MLFATHLLIGALVARNRFPVAWVVAGAALPDLVDKPLAMVGLVPTYHSVAHSALFAGVLGAGWLAARRYEAATAPGAVTAVGVGWVTHLVADAVHISINGRPENVVFLLWPLVRSWNSIGLGPGSFALQYLWTPSFYVEVAIWLLAGALLLRDGPPATDA
ncbi:metal-dependent hydrolase [Halorubrum sp. 2020YC2]|uniref:metal-dependent hydrolase n=1 Tax=Halorubrum sp. 2020YC2 TaxID=2836432 RepID=UPI001BE72E2E|nr:metal-dependent hydrolase [Halorubrum sp. 2020YC2]QWC19910.1 metal-dependent hydrolase [Halorubrum sp. 2020YC2]